MYYVSFCNAGHSGGEEYLQVHAASLQTCPSGIPTQSNYMHATKTLTHTFSEDF